MAVTRDQVDEFTLPSEVDEATLKKMKGYEKPDGSWKQADPNTAKFIEKYGRVYANELDSLPAKVTR